MEYPLLDTETEIRKMMDAAEKRQEESLDEGARAYRPGRNPPSCFSRAPIRAFCIWGGWLDGIAAWKVDTRWMSAKTARSEQDRAQTNGA
jgi:hypothetical protein